MLDLCHQPLHTNELDRILIQSQENPAWGTYHDLNLEQHIWTGFLEQARNSKDIFERAVGKMGFIAHLGFGCAKLAFYQLTDIEVVINGKDVSITTESERASLKMR